jgi:hypothetical protein
LGSWGGCSFKIHKITFIAGSSEYGASPQASSIAVIPTDQISAAKSWPDYSMTSGAIQHGEPTKVFLFYPFFKDVETPKSLMITFPSISKSMLVALISL